MYSFCFEIDRYFRLEMCPLFFSKKTLGELCEDVEVVRSTDSTFGNLEMTFKLNKVSVLFDSA